MKSLLILFISFFISSLKHSNPDAIVGIWKDGKGKGHIQIFRHNGKYYGKIIWLRDALNESGNPKVDKKNPSETLRNRPILGLIMLRDFVYDDGEWNGGYIYNPGDGKEYKAYMKLTDYNTLSVRGYIGFSIFGKTDIWFRVR